MKASIAALIVAISVFGQHVTAAPQGPIYNQDGQMVAFNHADGARQIYNHNAVSQANTVTDRVVTESSLSSSHTDAADTSNHRRKKPRPTPSPTPSPAPTPLDATLFTTYNFTPGNTSALYWSICGSTTQTSGCYASGNFGPFGKVGAAMEGSPTMDRASNTVTRDIYVLDIASGSNSNGVTLYVYKRTDTISSSSVSVTATLSTTLSLPLVGGNSALESMAANDNVLVIGTNQSSSAIEIQKSNFGISQLGGFDPPMNVAAITSDRYGYIAVTFGSFSNNNSAFLVVNPAGLLQEEGGGSDFMLNTVQAVLPSALP